MTPTIEEVKRVADKCGARKMLVGFNREYVATCFEQEQLQAFAQHYIEVGRKEQRESDETIATKYGDDCSGYEVATAIRNNTGE